MYLSGLSHLMVLTRTPYFLPASKASTRVSLSRAAC